MADFLFYDPKEKKLKSIPKDVYESNKDEIHSEGIYPEENIAGLEEASDKGFITGNDPTKSAITDPVGARPIIGAYPFVVESPSGVKFFKSVNVAKEYASKQGKSQLKVATIKPGKKGGSSNPEYVPENDFVAMQDSEYPPYALGKYNHKTLTAKDEKDYYEKEAQRRSDKGGLGVGTRAQTVGQNFVKGMLPPVGLFSGKVSEPLQEWTRDNENLTREYNKIPGNNPYRSGTILTEGIPQVAGNLASGLGAGSLEKAGLKGAAIGLESAMQPTSALAKAASKYLVPDVVKKGAASAAGKVSSAIPFTSVKAAGSLAGATGKNFLSAAGDTAIANVADKVGRGDEISTEELGKSALIGGAAGGLLGGIAKGVNAYMKSGRIIELDKVKNYIREIEDTLSTFSGKDGSVSPELQKFREGIDQIEKATKITLRDELLPDKEMLHGAHLPSMVESRLKTEQTKIDTLEQDIYDKAHPFSQEITTALSETMPAFYKNASERQRFNWSRSPDEYGVKSSYQDPREAVADFSNTYKKQLYEAGTGQPKEEVGREAEQMLLDENLYSKTPEGDIYRRPSQYPVENSGKPTIDQYPTDKPSDIVNVPPRGYDIPTSKPIESELFPGKNGYLDLPPEKVPDYLYESPPVEYPQPVSPPMEFPVKGMGKNDSRLAQKAMEIANAKKQQAAAGIVPPQTKFPVNGNNLEITGQAPRQPNPYLTESPYLKNPELIRPSNALGVNYLSTNAASLPLTPKNTYPATTFDTYDSLMRIFQEGNVRYAKNAEIRQVSVNAKADDVSRKASRAVLSRAFGDEFAIPNAAKRLVKDLEENLRGVSSISDKVSPSDIVANPSYAKGLVDAAKATAEMDPNRLLQAANAELGPINNKGYLELEQMKNIAPRMPDSLGNLEVAVKNVEQNKKLIEDSTFAGSTSGLPLPDVSKSNNILYFNQRLGALINDVKDAAYAWNERKTDKDYVALKSIVDKHWGPVMSALGRVRANDLGESGRIFRESVLWSSYVGNVPGLGTVGRLMSALNMAKYATRSGAKGDFTVKYQPLDAVVQAKNIDKFKNAIIDKYERYAQAIDTAEKLANLRGLGRAVANYNLSDPKLQQMREDLGQTIEQENNDQKTIMEDIKQKKIQGLRDAQNDEKLLESKVDELIEEGLNDEEISDMLQQAWGQ